MVQKTQKIYCQFFIEKKKKNANTKTFSKESGWNDLTIICTVYLSIHETKVTKYLENFLELLECN